MRLLLAEDERDLNRIITKKLTSSGYSVDSFFDGQEAIDVLAYTDYDAVILDIMMPKADGFAVLRAIRDAGENHAGAVPDGPGRRVRPGQGLGQRRQ